MLHIPQMSSVELHSKQHGPHITSKVAHLPAIIGQDDDLAEELRHVHVFRCHSDCRDL